jgi:hypothetical protein
MKLADRPNDNVFPPFALRIVRAPSWLRRAELEELTASTIVRAKMLVAPRRAVGVSKIGLGKKHDGVPRRFRVNRRGASLASGRNDEWDIGVAGKVAL